MLPEATNPVWTVLGIGVALLLALTIIFYRKQRDESKKVRSLLTFLLSSRALYDPLYQEQPAETLEAVRSIQARLKEDLARLPGETRAFWLVREMNEACLVFLSRVDPLTRVDLSPTPGETELLSDKWVDGLHRQTLGEALVRLRNTLTSCMEELREVYGLEKPSARARYPGARPSP